MTDLAIIPPSGVELLGRMTATAGKLRSVIEVLPLDTPEAEQHAAEFVRAIEGLIRESEKARKEIVAPIKEKTKAVDAAFRGPRTELKALGDRIRYRLQEVAEVRERARRAALEAARAAETAAQANAALATVQEAPPTPGVSMRWSWEVVAIQPEAVPLDFMIVDMGKLKALCKNADKGGAEPRVPGVTFELKAHSVVRS